jgi:AraC family transcriptional regulator, exoenzyme S synthesis regulatory protein ExsA
LFSMSISKENKAKILYNCYFTRSQEGEQFIPEHVLSFQVAGTLTINDGEKSYTYNEGDFRFSRRNQLVKFIKQPPENGEFKSLSIYLDQETLRALSKELNLTAARNFVSDDAVIALKNHPLYKSYMDSLLVYLQLPEGEQSAIMDLKVREAVQLLLKVNPEIIDVLFDFSEPGKIDLEEFMLKNFQFNVQLNRFAYLTGRSLSTFKRDFEKKFHTTPSRWLLQQRLQEAYYQIREKGKAPSDVYIEVGFENLSHFSFAFKKKYGSAPSLLK